MHNSRDNPENHDLHFSAVETSNYTSGTSADRQQCSGYISRTSTLKMEAALPPKRWFTTTKLCDAKALKTNASLQDLGPFVISGNVLYPKILHHEYES